MVNHQILVLSNSNSVVQQKKFFQALDHVGRRYGIVLVETHQRVLLRDQLMQLPLHVLRLLVRLRSIPCHLQIGCDKVD